MEEGKRREETGKWFMERETWEWRKKEVNNFGNNCTGKRKRWIECQRSKAEIEKQKCKCKRDREIVQKWDGNTNTLINSRNEMGTIDE